MTIELGDSPVAKAVDLVVSSRWYSLGQFIDILKQSAKSKQNRLARSIVDCLVFPPFLDVDSRRAFYRLASINSEIACSCSVFNVALEIAFKHILCKDYARANLHAQSAIVALIDVIAQASESISSSSAEYLMGRSRYMINCLVSQAELFEAINNSEIAGKLVFVLGMHRSGTSALTGMLAKAGLSAPHDLMPAGPNNPKGYWESLDIIRENDRFLSQMDFQWSSSLTLPFEWTTSDRAREWRSELLHIILRVYKNARNPIVKDPRFCILIKGMEPWFETGLIDPVFLVPVRHPIEVARSLEKAEDLPITQGLKLWIKSLFEVESATRGFKRKFIMFNDLMGDPACVLRKCMGFIGPLSLNGSDDLAVEPFADPVPADESIAFIDPSLQHQRITIGTEPWRGGDLLVDRLAAFAVAVYTEVLSSVDGDVSVDIFDSLRLSSLSFVA
jgi:hypothetical protein